MRKVKIIALFMTGMVMTFALCACKNNNDIITPHPTEDQPVPTEVVEEEIRGQISDRTYKNDYFGIGLTLDEATWDYATEDDIAEILGIMDDISNENQTIAQQLERGEYIYDMLAVARDGLKNINLTIENMEQVYGNRITTKDYANTAADVIAQTYDSLGYINQTQYVTQVTFMGETATAINCYAELPVEDGQTPMYQLQIFVPQNEYMAVITITSYITDDTKSIAKMFFAPA